MAYTKLWLHIIIYKDKHSSALLIDRRTELIKYLERKCDKKGIVLEAANGDDSHLHFLIGIGNQYTVKQVVTFLFEESKEWQRTHHTTISLLKWEDKYFAVSVSESQIIKLKEYIALDNKRHPKISPQNELKLFLEKYGFYKK